jgi:hypothetical protein
MPQDLEMGKLTRFSNWLHEASKGWVAFVGLIIFLLFTILVLPDQSQKAELVSGKAGSPDTSFFYSPSDLTSMALAYGEQGRKAYVKARFTFDLIFPIVYTFFLVTALSWFIGKSFTTSNPMRLANLIPLLGMLCDYLENFTASIAMLRYPKPASLASILAPFFTLLKWSFIGLSFALLAISILISLWKWRKRKSVTPV